MKQSASDSPPLPAGAAVGPLSIAEPIGRDDQVWVYRAEKVDGSPVMLLEFLPAGLAARGAAGVTALPGRHDAFAAASAALSTRLRATALVGHPALPSTDEIWRDRGTVYATWAWRPGRSLLDEIASRQGPVDRRTLDAWVRSLCDALGSLHQHGLVHGNLSMGMLRVLESGELQLPPLGSAVIAGEGPPWLAPEQHPLNPEPAAVGPWTDVYQLCAILLQAMTGRPLPSLAMRWQGASPFDRLADLAGRYPESLVLAVKRGLSVPPQARAQSICQWLAEAGLPDRREHARYDPDEPQPLPVADGTTPVSRPAELADAGYRSTSPAPLVPNSGHLPLRQTVEERLEHAERSVRHAQRGTPAWVWPAAILALAALVGIVLLA